MKILILSDSHYRRLDDIDFKKYDYVIHSGDYGSSYEILNENGVYFVRGNCDINGLLENNITIENKKIMILHGHQSGVKDGYMRLIYRALSKKVDYVFFGHTHIPDMFIQEGITFINPGAYMDGYYVVINDDLISFYKNDKVYKEFRRKW